MANTCTICRHKQREAIEELLASGAPFRHIASQFGVGYKSVERHQQCISSLLKEVRERQVINTSTNVLGKLRRYQEIAESYLEDRETALPALDRCYKLLDVEAKLTGAYQRSQENQHDKKRRRFILVEALLIIHKEKGESKTREEINDEIDVSVRDIERVWAEAERRAIENGYIN